MTRRNKLKATWLAVVTVSGQDELYGVDLVWTHSRFCCSNTRVQQQKRNRRKSKKGRFNSRRREPQNLDQQRHRRTNRNKCEHMETKRNTHSCSNHSHEGQCKCAKGLTCSFRALRSSGILLGHCIAQGRDSAAAALAGAPAKALRNCTRRGVRRVLVGVLGVG